MRLVGIDPGLASFGWAVVDLDGGAMSVLDVGVFVTEKSARKRGVLVADDNVRRGRELASGLWHLFDAHRPVVVCAESMSHPRQSSCAAKLALSWGLAIGEIHRRGIPIAMASPQEIKRKVCGARDASKDEVGAALCGRWPALPVLLAQMPKGLREHAQDALAAIVAGQDAEVVRLAMTMSRERIGADVVVEVMG